MLESPRTLNFEREMQLGLAIQQHCSSPVAGSGNKTWGFGNYFVLHRCSPVRITVKVGKTHIIAHRTLTILCFRKILMKHTNL